MVSYYNQPFWVWGPLFGRHCLLAHMACCLRTALGVQSIEEPLGTFLPAMFVFEIPMTL